MEINQAREDTGVPALAMVHYKKSRSNPSAPSAKTMTPSKRSETSTPPRRVKTRLVKHRETVAENPLPGPFPRDNFKHIHNKRETLLLHPRPFRYLPASNRSDRHVPVACHRVTKILTLDQILPMQKRNDMPLPSIHI